MELNIETINKNNLIKTIYNYDGYLSLTKTILKQAYLEYSQVLKEIMGYKKLSFHPVPETNHYIDNLKKYSKCEKFYKSKLFCDYLSGSGLTPEDVIEKIKIKNGYQE